MNDNVTCWTNIPSVWTHLPWHITHHISAHTSHTSQAACNSQGDMVVYLRSLDSYGNRSTRTFLGLLFSCSWHIIIVSQMRDIKGNVSKTKKHHTKASMTEGQPGQGGPCVGCNMVVGSIDVLPVYQLCWALNLPVQLLRAFSPCARLEGRTWTAIWTHSRRTCSTRSAKASRNTFTHAHVTGEAKGGWNWNTLGLHSRVCRQGVCSRAWLWHGNKQPIKTRCKQCTESPRRRNILCGLDLISGIDVHTFFVRAPSWRPSKPPDNMTNSWKLAIGAPFVGVEPAHDSIRAIQA